MATTGRSQDLDVSRGFLGRALREHPGRFDFFQAVRVLERLSPGRAPVGFFGPPSREVVRFGVNNSLSFPPSPIQELEFLPGGASRMVVNFFGLTGPCGVLPPSYTELLRDRSRAKDRGLAEFFDLFNHRMLSLFYQAWEKYRVFVSYERDQRTSALADQSGTRFQLALVEDRFSRLLASFVGLGTEGLQNRQPVRDESFLFYSGLFALQARSATALEQILADYFGVRAEVEQFVGAWHSVSLSDCCTLDAGIPYSEQVGLGAIAGDEVWDLQSRARVTLGPMSLAKYRSFLPTGRSWQPLTALLRFFGGNEFEFEVQLVLARDEVPACGLPAEEEAMPLLGWTTWMKSGAGFGRDPGDTILMLN